MVLRSLDFKLGGQSSRSSLGSCLAFLVGSVGIAVDAYLIAIGILFINDCSKVLSSRRWDHNIGQFDGWKSLLQLFKLPLLGGQPPLKFVPLLVSIEPLAQVLQPLETTPILPLLETFIDGPGIDCMLPRRQQLESFVCGLIVSDRPASVIIAPRVKLKGVLVAALRRVHQRMKRLV